MKSFTKKLTGFIAAALFVVTIGGALGATVPTTNVSANCDGNNAFLTFPAWYRGMTDADCNIVAPEDSSDGISAFIWKIVLNVIEIALQLVAYLALFFIIYGGFQYITSSGSADQASKAMKTILNALIGLVIAIGSVAIVNLILDAANLRGGASSGVVELEASVVLGSILGVVYWIAGVVAVIVIILAGMTYITSSGDAGKVAKAKNAIIYGAIGLLIVIMASVITNFFIGLLGG